MGFDSTKYKNKFQIQNYDRLNIILRKGAKAEIKVFAESRNLSVNALVIQAIEKTYGLNLTDKKKPI